MSVIPLKMRAEMAEDPFYEVCIRDNEDCSGRIEWEHAMYYSGRKIQEKWAILPVCYYHHRGGGLDKEFHRWVALSRASDKDLLKYPKSDFHQMKKYLNKKYGEYENRMGE